MTTGKCGCVALAVLTALLAGCAKEKEVESEPVLPVQVAEVHQGSIQRVITAQGVLRALDQSAVMPKISAPVNKFFVNRGDHVRAGQVVATLENQDLAAAVVDTKGAYDQAEANYRNTSAATVPDELVKAQSDVQASKEGLDAAKKLLDSRTQLYKEGALARRQVDEASVAYAQAKSQFDTAQKHLQSVEGVGRQEEVKGAAGALDSAKGKYEAAKAQLSYSEIRSPISGVIADRPVFPGEMASPGTPLLTVMDISSVIARVSVPQTQASWIRVGQVGKIAATDGSMEVTGKVTVVSPAVDPQSTTVEIWVQAQNSGERLRPGGTVNVTIFADTVREAMLVPAAALLPGEEGGTAVMVVGADSVAHQHKVQVGVRGPEDVQILTGVALGDKVVVAGGVGLDDGAKVKIQKPGEAGDKAGDKAADKDEK